MNEHGVPETANAAADIELLCLDVDGVMTDGGILLDDHGVETKRFCVRDGTGIRLWRRLGYEVALITGRSGDALRHRAKELEIVLPDRRRIQARVMPQHAHFDPDGERLRV